MRFDLRTLFILAAVLPPLLTIPWWIRDPKWNVHEASAALSIGTYSLAVLCLAAVYRRKHHWSNPPKKTPLAYTLLFASIISAVSGVGFFLTFPPSRYRTSEENAERDRNGIKDPPSILYSP